MGHMTPRHVPVPVPPLSVTPPTVAYLVRVRVRPNAERHFSAGQKVGKLEVLLEIEKAVDNG